MRRYSEAQGASEFEGEWQRRPRDEEFVTVYRLKVLTELNTVNLKRHLTILIKHGLIKEVEMEHQ